MIKNIILKPKGEFSLKKLAGFTKDKIIGKKNIIIKNISSIQNASSGSITFIDNKKYIEKLNSTKASACIISENVYSKYTSNGGMTFLVSNNPYLSYAKILNIFYPDLKSIHKEKNIQFVLSKSSQVSKNVDLKNNVNIGDETIINSFSSIGPNVFIGPNCIIKGNVKINANCSVVKNVTIDEDTLIHHGSVLGSDGFGFAPSKDGYTKIEQLGGLKIGKKVEIGANCTLDRGALDDTVIGDGVIFDNQIHIAHNVVIGKNSAIAASCAIAGSSVIGENFQMGGLSGVLGHLKICDNVKVGAHTLITKNIDEPGEYIGIMPAQEHKAWAKSSVYIKNKGK